MQHYTQMQQHLAAIHPNPRKYASLVYDQVKQMDERGPCNIGPPGAVDCYGAHWKLSTSAHSWPPMMTKTCFTPCL